MSSPDSTQAWSPQTSQLSPAGGWTGVNSQTKTRNQLRFYLKPVCFVWLTAKTKEAKTKEVNKGSSPGYLEPWRGSFLGGLGTSPWDHTAKCVTNYPAANTAMVLPGKQGSEQPSQQCCFPTHPGCTNSPSQPALPKDPWSWEIQCK